jgi:type IV secretory pathway VirB3-like protein
MRIPNLIYSQSFTLFSESFVSISIFYILIVMVLITYNVYGLMLQKAISECMALVLLMSCYLIVNDDLMALDFVIFNKFNNK